MNRLPRSTPPASRTPWAVARVARACAFLATAALTVGFPPVDCLKPATASTTPSDADRVARAATLGIETGYSFEYSGPPLAARPVDDRSPLMVRIAGVAHQPDGTRYELRFIGVVAGRYDLADWIVGVDGQPVEGLPAMRVMLVETLPADHDGSLEMPASPRVPSGWPYRGTMLGLLALWIVVTVGWMAVRIARRKPRPVAAAEAVAPSLADQLRPLVEAALAEELSTAGQARLERLLVAHWRGDLQLDGLPLDQALSRIRADRRAGHLLRTLEAWLHDRPGRRQVDVPALLAPYRAAMPIALEGEEMAAATTNC